MLCVTRGSCCWNKALVSVIMVAISCLRSWIVAARSVAFWLLFLVVFELLASVSMSLDIDRVVVAKVAMAVLNCSTALVIIVVSALISVLIDRSSVA